MRVLCVATCAALSAAAVQAAAPAVAAPAPLATSEVDAFYRGEAAKPLWTNRRGLRPEAALLVARIAGARDDGLDPADYGLAALRRAAESAEGSPRALARAERLFSAAYVRLVADLHRPAAADMIYIDADLAPRALGAERLLDSAARAPSLAAHLDAATRVNPVYWAMRQGFAAHRDRLAAAAPTIRVPAGPVLALGAGGERARLLRGRLGLPADGVFDAATAAAVRDFQAAHGLAADGRAGPATLQALNAGDSGAALLAANLERARALGATPARFILVDAAAQRLWLYEDGVPADAMKVVVGKPSDPTPMMAAYIRFLTLNPYWNLPPDLARNRIAPRVLAAGPGFIARNGYEVLSGWDAAARVIDAGRVDWRAVAAGKADVRVRQLPGPRNAMGAMKFMLPNRYGIYLHDTPDRQLFARDPRLFSAGCIRVEDARRLAKWLFGRVPAAGGAPEQNVDLPAPVPVYISYFTAAPDGTGIAFRPDRYRRDPALLSRLTPQTVIPDLIRDPS